MVCNSTDECDQNMSGGIGHEMDDNDIDDNDNNGAVGFDMNDPLIGFDDNGDVVRQLLQRAQNLFREVVRKDG